MWKIEIEEFEMSEKWPELSVSDEELLEFDSIEADEFEAEFWDGLI